MLRELWHRHRATWRLATASAAAGLALAAGAVALAGPWDAGQRTAERNSAAASQTAAPPAARAATVSGAGQVLAPVGGGGTPPARAALARALGDALDDPALGRDATAAVRDVSTGDLLYADEAQAGVVPASTQKLVTAVTALRALGGDHRLTTTVAWDESAERVILVGGGDTTLRDDALRELAGDAARNLAGRGVTTARVGYDVSLFPTQVHPLGLDENLARVSPLSVAAGRLDGSYFGPAPRAADPAADAARRFARHLADAGLTVRGGEPASGAAPGDAERVATHRSAPLAALVERLLTHSDNDLGEALARHTALATGHRGDFRGARRAAEEVLDSLGLPLRGVHLADGSGLDRSGRLTAGLLTGLLALAADPGHPELRPAVTGMPVAGFTGTLTGRFAAGDGGAGVVRAKTGTLTGVNSLAGTVTTPDGRLLAFAFLAEGSTDPAAAESALDAAASALATCACR